VKGTYAVGAVLGYVEASEAMRTLPETRATTSWRSAKGIPGRQEESAKAVKTQTESGSHFTVDETALPQVATTIGDGPVADCLCPRAQKARLSFTARTGADAGIEPD